ncbi:hypothetical protein BOTCAL_0047g00030 [Botryotinia calthae]|uniref:Uncharacterized protein n=1 Tax=Botryotinia calthae TaxID=38488 RepID=A0A4Y8DBM4_9HELO|nr:hypothetical protein BOTCAL_0047g00030 [Botryotinia calthae]
MQVFFGKKKAKAAKSPATSVQSGSHRPQQERRHSDCVEGRSSHRPNLSPRSSTWHSSTAGERLGSLFKRSKKKKNIPDDEIWCRGEEKTNMLENQEDSSSRGNTSRQPAYVDALNPVPVPIRSGNEAGQVRSRVFTRDSRSGDEKQNPSSRSRSEYSLASRRTTSSITPPTNQKSLYVKLSATSHVNPRSASSVPRQKPIGNFGSESDPEKWRGRDGRNSRRNLVRDAKDRSPDGGTSSSKGNRKKTKTSHHSSKALVDNISNQENQPTEGKGKITSSRSIKPDNHNYYEEPCYDSASIRNGRTPTSTRKVNPNPSARKAAMADDHNRSGDIVHFKDRKPHSSKAYSHNVNLDPRNHRLRNGQGHYA